MGVSADEKFRRTCHQTADNRRVVLARIPADMLDQHFRSVHREAVHLREHLPYFLPVYVAVNCPQGPELVAWRVAAALLIAVSSVAVYLAVQNRQAPDVLQAYIPTAETRNITLPDGTQVMINSRSTLLYPQRFTGDTRCVYLVGEADFKVKRDERHPFIVKSSDFQITALGTEFNVTAYPEEEEVTATLISGKVLVEYNDQKEQKILEPNEQLAYNKHTRSGSVLRPDMQDVTAWHRGEIVFRSMTMEEIFTRLERKYPYTFVYSFRSLREDRFNLSFGPNASIEEVLDIIARVTGNLEYKIVGDKCYLSHLTE